MNRVASLLRILWVLPVFSSSYFLVAPLGNYKVPLYILGLMAMFFVSLRKVYKFILFPVVLTILFYVLIVVAVFYNGNSLVGVNIRQWLVFGSLFLTSYLGYLYIRTGGEKQISARVRELVLIHSLLFLYGIYTYYAQAWNMAEFLGFLRPNPVVGEDNINRFSGWASPYRAYSVWFEPSYVSIVFAGILPIVRLLDSLKTQYLFLFIGGLFAVLTFSRSVWLICVFWMVLELFRYYFPNRISAARLVVLCVSISIMAYLVQLYSVFYYDDISARIRFFSSAKAVNEILMSPLFGYGTPELIETTVAAEGSNHIHNSYLAILHWVGIGGAVLFLGPTYYLANRFSKMNNDVCTLLAQYSLLSALAFSVGGGLLSLATYWFFFGIYFGVAQYIEIVGTRETRQSDRYWVTTNKGLVNS